MSSDSLPCPHWATTRQIITSPQPDLCSYCTVDQFLARSGRRVFCLRPGYTPSNLPGLLTDIWPAEWSGARSGGRNRLTFRKKIPASHFWFTHWIKTAGVTFGGAERPGWGRDSCGRTMAVITLLSCSLLLLAATAAQAQLRDDFRNTPRHHFNESGRFSVHWKVFKY